MRSLWITYACRFIALLCIYSLGRCAFYVLNQEAFGLIAFTELMSIFKAGLIFDVSALCYLNIVLAIFLFFPWSFFTTPRRIRIFEVCFFSLNTAGILLNCIDIAYYPFILKRATASAFSEFKHEIHLGKSLGSLLWVHWQATIPFLFLTFLFYLSVRGFPLKPISQSKHFSVYMQRAASFVLIILLFWTGARGGSLSVSHRPISNANAAQYVSKSEYIAIVLNTPFSIIRTYDKENLEPVSFFKTDSELNHVFTTFRQVKGNTTSFQKKNVVIFILESFGPSAIGHLNDGTQSYTPFLDSLFERCRYYSNAYANGLHSIEAPAPIFASIPNLKQTFVLSHYYSNRFDSIASLLKTKNYTTSFFHGAPNGSMGFEAFVKQAGFEHYYGMNEFPNLNETNKGAWGIWDEDFLMFMLDTMHNMPQPFLTSIFTLTSHSPFTLPEKYQNTFKQGTSPAHPVMGYTDMALKKFFERASQESWFKNTLFIFTADHSAVRITPYFKTALGRFRVPLLLCDFSNSLLQGEDTLPAQHVDIMPTILSYVGYDKRFASFGVDLLDKSSNRIAFQYHPDGFYQLVTKEHVLQSTDLSQVDRLFDYRHDRLLENSLIVKKQNVEQEFSLLKAIVQQYNQQMIHNTLQSTQP